MLYLILFLGLVLIVDVIYISLDYLIYAFARFDEPFLKLKNLDFVAFTDRCQLSLVILQLIVVLILKCLDLLDSNLDLFLALVESVCVLLEQALHGR
jgi:hypothetical protein